MDTEDRLLSQVDNPDAYSRAKLELRKQPYQAAVLPEIAASSFAVEPATVTEAGEASNAIARFDSEFAVFPAPFAAVLLRSESASSSQIEHLTSGARAIAEAEIGERVTGNAPYIVRNVRAMEAAIALSETIDNHAVIEMHRALLGDIAPDAVGRYRGEQVWIGGELPQVASFVPPHHERVSAAMDDLIAFTRRTDMPLLIQTAIAHAQFETIHPFPDGNGRTGRALVQAMLRNGGLLRHMTVPVSSGLLTDVDRYFDALGAYRAGDPNPIVQAFSDATFAGLQNARHLASDITVLQDAWAERMAGLRSDAAARKLATLSIEHPAINSNLAAERLGVSLPTVLNGLRQLVDRGILTPANSRARNRIWVNVEVIDALDALALRSGRRRSPVY